MSMSLGSKLQLEPGSWQEAVYDVYIGVVVGGRHSAFLVSRGIYNLVVHPVFALLGIQTVDPTEAATNTEGLKVVAVGYGRTGTYSVTLALEELGFPTLHTQHLYENEEIINMWTNEVFLPSIKAGKVDLGKPNLDIIAKKFQATADLPMALYFEQVMEQYPDCKFILTERENSEVWFRSWDILTKSITTPTQTGGMFFSKVKQYSHYLRWLYSIVNQDEAFLTSPFPFPDQNKEMAIMSYEEHNRRVRATIPSNRLLEYNVNQGWEPLCNFLEIESCPATPFPKTNSARSVKVQSISAQLVPLVVSLFVLFTLFAKGFQSITGKPVVGWARYKSAQVSRNIERALNGEKVCWTNGSPPSAAQKRKRRSRVAS